MSQNTNTLQNVISIVAVRDEKNRIKYDIDLSGALVDEEHEMRKAIHDTLVGSKFESHHMIAATVLDQGQPVVRVNPSALRRIAQALSEIDPQTEIIEAARNAIAEATEQTAVTHLNEEAQIAAQSTEPTSAPATGPTNATQVAVLEAQVSRLTQMLIAAGVSENIVAQSLAELPA